MQLSILLATCLDADIELPALSHPEFCFEYKFLAFPITSQGHPKDRAYPSEYSTNRALPEAAVTTSRACSLLRRV